MTEREADQILQEAELTPVMQAPLAYAKELLEKCLAADIPAALIMPDGCDEGCEPRLDLLVRPDDVSRVAQLMRDDWLGLVEREGTVSFGGAAGRAEGGDGESAEAEAEDEDSEPPCPACGTAAPLVDGACSDCGLTLA